ncbi:MAG TPA: FHA domain-containing protein [Solirubrobacteraceae bacterium]|nr:FHA domain-containing protein [Solirubrobacteraceae bacterium]
MTNASQEHSERPTAALGLPADGAVDAGELLDHRSRELLIPRATAPAGRYLGVALRGVPMLMSLSRPITHIGRGLLADVRLEDPRVSRRHAIVAVRGDRVRALDDRSVNGTFVNGAAVTIAELSDGDILRVGPAVFEYVEVALVRDQAPHGRPRLHRIRPPRSPRNPRPAAA